MRGNEFPIRERQEVFVTRFIRFGRSGEDYNGTAVRKPDLEPEAVDRLDRERLGGNHPTAGLDQGVAFEIRFTDFGPDVLDQRLTSQRLLRLREPCQSRAELVRLELDSHT